MRRTKIVAIALAMFALPIIAAACSESPTTTKAPPTWSAECGPLPPPDTTLCRNGTLGSGGRTCC
jgi:hypothetical protein